MLFGGIKMQVNGTSLFASKPISTPPPRTSESTGALASSIFSGISVASNTTSSSIFGGGSSGGGSTESTGTLA